MDGALKAGGIVGGMGVAITFVMLAYRVVNDPNLTYFVVGGGMLAFILMLAIVAFAFWRSAMEARAASLALSAERSLISARALRTIDGVQVNKPAGPDWLGQLIAGAPGSDIVDTGQHALAWPDDDKGE